MKPRSSDAVRRGVGLVLVIDALALAVVLATAPAAYLWLNGSRPSPFAVSSAGASGSGAASPAATGSPGAASPSPSGAGATPTGPGPTQTLTYGNGTWSRIPALPQPLWGMGSAVLGDGRVLVVGGSTGPVSSTAVATAEILDPKTSSWSAATPMLQARTYPATVTLPDGSVLVVGGSRDGLPLDSAERYFPDSVSWVSAGTMSVPRTHATATVLEDGRVLVAGGGSEGSSAFKSTNTAEIFDPATGNWTPTASMAFSRALHTATLLADGEVLVTGGASTYHGSKGTVRATAEIYDPQTATWRAAAPISVPRYHHTAVLLSDGRVLIAGGWSFTTNSDPSLATAEIYDPAADTWTATGSMAVGRARARMTALPDGRVLVVGGVDPAYRVMATAELFDPATGLWKSTGRLATAVMWPAMAVLRDGRVVVAGGALEALAGHVTAVCAIYAPPAP
jgi:N-acetylneuraminic acid mutarotase